MATESVAPVFASASVPSNGASVAVLLTEADSPPILPATGVTGFTVLVDGVSRPISSATASSLTVTLNLATPIQDDQVVKLSYSGGNVTDSATTPNPLTAFSNQTVTNNSTVPDVTGPSAPTTLNAVTTQKTVLTWSEVPEMAYKVYRNGVFLDDVAIGTYTYTDDTAPINGTPNVYRVAAVDASDNETKSASVRLGLGAVKSQDNKLGLITGEANTIFYTVNGITRTPNGDIA